MIDTEALRKKVIDLAIQGKLTEQLPSDGDAETLYAQIQEEKAKLIKEGKIKKDKVLPSISDDEIPFEIPKNWKWVRLIECGISQTGNTPSKTHPEYFGSDIPFLGPGDIQNGEITFGRQGLTNVGKEFGRVCGAGSIMQVCIGGSIGKCAITNRETAFNQQINSISPIIIESEYIFYVLCSDYFKKAILRYSSGMATPIINKSAWDLLLIPLPPYFEQKRIAKVIDNVFILIKKIDTLQQQYKSNLSVLKGKLIDAGIRGKLTEQLPEDGDAETLYLQIHEEKAKLIKEGKIKKEKPLPEIGADEIPFEIPNSWKWVRVGEVTYNHGQKTPDNTFSYIDVGTLDNVNHRLNDAENIVEAVDAPSRAKKIVESGDVLYSTVRPYLHNICVVDKEFSHEPIASTAFVVMHTLRECLVNRFLFYWLLSGWFDKYANGNNSKGTLYPAIGEKDFLNGLIPIPPYEEQKRIVEKMDEMLKLI